MCGGTYRLMSIIENNLEGKSEIENVNHTPFMSNYRWNAPPTLSQHPQQASKSFLHLN